ncbi:MAG TPA: DedA family protein [Polyangia bacterium]|nr:DedA family protein [Polyangia bacterium]
MERVVAELTAVVTGAVGATGYWGIVVLMALESACVPIPSEIIMPFAGYLAYRGELSLTGASLAGAFGCVVGSCAAYAVGARGGRPAIERWGRWVLVAPHELEIADRWFARWGRSAVFVARLLPVVRTFIALPAGIARMDVWPFVWLTFAGSLPWCAALAYGGFLLAEQWMTLRERLHGLDTAVIVVLALGFVAFLWQRVRALRAAGLFDHPRQNR